jgi:predicted metal-binding protein
MAATLHVCTTCRGQASEAAPPGCAGGAPRAGALLHAALLAAGPQPAGLQICAVECLSACDQGCNLSLSAPGKWAYVYGRLSPADAAEILHGARLYAASPDGLVPWRERPAIFRKQCLARIPPLEPQP